MLSDSVSIYIFASMKLLASFVAMYMVLLSIAPCGDKEECRLEYSFNVSIVDAHHESSTSHDVETCTPFCSCNCCSISMAETLPSFAATVEEEVWDIDILYKNNVDLRNSAAIWQPPQGV